MVWIPIFKTQILWIKLWNGLVCWLVSHSFTQHHCIPDWYSRFSSTWWLTPFARVLASSFWSWKREQHSIKVALFWQPSLRWTSQAMHKFLYRWSNVCLFKWVFFLQFYSKAWKLERLYYLVFCFSLSINCVSVWMILFYSDYHEANLPMVN